MIGRRKASRLVAISLVWCAFPVVAVAQPIDESLALERMLGGESYLQGEQLERALEEAAAHPLGERENPVRASTPAGQRAYLSRLRCADGRVPRFNRAGSFGAGVFGNIIDGYEVSCSASRQARTIFMDMYHLDYVEGRPVPGFTIVPVD